MEFRFAGVESNGLDNSPVNPRITRRKKVVRHVEGRIASFHASPSDENLSQKCENFEDGQ